MKHIAVIGGGITGVTTAYALAQQGFSVTLFERHRYAGMETSYANGGQLSASNAEVWNHWSTLVKGLKWMTRRDAPLLFHPQASWHQWSWLTEFVAQLPHYEANTIYTAQLAIAARAYLFKWAQQEAIDFDLKREGILHIYRDKQSFNHAAKVSALLQKGGLERRAVSPLEMQQIEPALQGDFYGGFFTESDSTGDIHKFTYGLSKALGRMGVETVYESDVRHLKTNGDHVQLQVKRGDELVAFQADAAVVCCGTNSRELASQVGDRVNVYPVKGYSITVHLNDAHSQTSAPQVSLLDDATKLVTSRLGLDRFRVAGTAEFNGFNKDIRADRIQPLVDWVAQCFPGISTRQFTPWAGLRPMMPNMLPKVGSGKTPNVFYNTGHGHLGWTLSAATAVSVANSVVDARNAKSPVSLRVRPVSEMA
ncbi:MAG: D-amino acid dehydrogenase [Betaproteobacteria bacterium]|nr:D-amino acid dehydrogenase [Betaproteobacteria bacterium]